MIVNLTISLFLKTRRFKAWTIDELKSLKGIKEASSDAAKGSLMSAFRLSTAIDARILNIPRVMGYIADADSRVRATIQQQSTAHHGTCQPSSDVESTATIAPNEVYIFTGDYIVRYLFNGDDLSRLRTFRSWPPGIWYPWILDATTEPDQLDRLGRT
jgi:hypothetical protein